MTTTICIDLQPLDLRRLARGSRITRTAAGYRVTLRLDPSLTARDLLIAIAATLGDDPIIAAELNPRSKK